MTSRDNYWHQAFFDGWHTSKHYTNVHAMHCSYKWLQAKHSSNNFLYLILVQQLRQFETEPVIKTGKHSRHESLAEPLSWCRNNRGKPSTTMATQYDLHDTRLGFHSAACNQGQSTRATIWKQFTNHSLVHTLVTSTWWPPACKSKSGISKSITNYYSKNKAFLMFNAF